MSFESTKSSGVVGTEEELTKPKLGEVCMVNGGGVKGIDDGGGDGI